MSVIECEKLSKSYGDTQAVRALDLNVEAGEIFGFLGPNGAGKTTTLRMLLGLIRPTAGAAQVLGRPAGSHTTLAAIGAMVEEPAFYPWLSGRDNLRVLADTGTRVPSDGIDAALGRAGAISFADRRVRTFSQGMRQRLGLAAALLRRPRLLLLDEPTNGLDPEGIREFRDVVGNLRAEGVTVVLCSHLLGEVEQVCDRVAVVLGGRLVGQAQPGSLASRHHFRVILDPDSLPAACSALRRFPSQRLGADAISVAADTGRDVWGALTAAGIAAEALIPERPSLEAWYLSLTTPERLDNTHALAAS